MVIKLLFGFKNAAAHHLENKKKFNSEADFVLQGFFLSTKGGSVLSFHLSILFRALSHRHWQQYLTQMH